MLDLDEVVDYVRDIDGERARYRGFARDAVRMWELQYWTEEDRILAQQEGRELVTSMEPRSIVNLASRIISNEPRITCPVSDPSKEAEYNSKARARFLKTLIQIQGESQNIDPLAACKFNMLVRGRAALKVLWVRDFMPKEQRDYLPPIRYIPLNPEKIGIAYGDFYPTFAFHRVEQKARSLKQQYPNAKFWDKYNKKPTDMVELTDCWWTDGDGNVWQAVLLDEKEFVVEPRETKYPRIPIIERKNDPVPLEGEHRNSPGILWPLAEYWEKRNQLLSMQMTAVANYMWPPVNAVNEFSQEIPPIERGLGAFNQLPAGTKFVPIPGDKPDVGLVGGLAADMGGQIVQSTFAPELYGVAPDSRQAGYSMAMLLEAAQGRVKDTVFQLEQLLREANIITLCAVEKFSGKKGVRIYGYDDANKAMFEAALHPDQIGGEYNNNVSLAQRLPTDKMQTGAMALQMLQAKVLSRRTVRDQYLPYEAPDDEEIQVYAEAIESDPDLMRAVVREAAMLKGIMLPENEPDWQDTMAKQEAMMMQQQQMMAQQPQQLPNIGIMQNAPDLMGGMGGGGTTPEMMGDPSMMASQMDMMQGQMPSPEQMAYEEAMASGQGRPRDMRPQP